MPTPTPSTTGHSHDAEHPARRALDALLRPRRIAVFGASDEEESVGHLLLHNLLAHQRDNVFVVTPEHTTVAHMQPYPSLAAIPHPVDLALVALPAPMLPGVVHECAAAGVAVAVIFAAGAAERAHARAALPPSLLLVAQQHGLRLIGPTSFGMQRPPAGLNAAAVSTMAQRGRVAFVSESDALCRAVLDWSRQENVGFSAFLSLGSMLDVDWGDVLDVLGDDVHTDSIVLHMETVGNARALVSAARDVAFRKPIIVLKTPAAGAVEAVQAQAGLHVSGDAVFDAVARRCGMVRVDTVAEVFNMAAVLAKQGRPHGPRLAIITNAGGPGRLAAGALLRQGGELAPVAPATMRELDNVPPAQPDQGMILDLGDDADPERYHAALDAVAKSHAANGVLVILTPHTAADPDATAQVLVPYAKMTGKPLLASWMGGDAVHNAKALLNRAGIPTFAYPDTAARMFSTMWHYSSHLRSLYETPMLAANDQAAARQDVATIIEHARHAGRTALTEAEALTVLAAYGIPTFPPPAAEGAATDRSADHPAHPNGYTLRLGSTIDVHFGPVLVCGVSAPGNSASVEPVLGVPPLTTTLARRMLEQGRLVHPFPGTGGEPRVDMHALEQLLVRFSHLVVEQPWIKEIHIDPLLVTPSHLAALHVDMLLHGPQVSAEHLPQPVIRPYPTQYVAPWTLKDGTPILIRPIRPEDEPLMVRFHATLGERSVVLRYFAPLTLSRRTEHERLTRICFIDYDREMALVAERTDPATGEHAILAVGRLAKVFGAHSAEFALLISDHAQGQGLGSELLRRLIAVGRDERLKEITALILPENRAMQRVAEKLGFRLRRMLHDDVVLAHLDLLP